MKVIVIQCAGQKRKGAGRMKAPSGEDVLFVARPELGPRNGQPPVRYCRPDDPVEPGSVTWRERLIDYNLAGGNPRGLSAAADLYRPEVYRTLAIAWGRENLYILSAGWGLIRSDFLTPDYNVTFCAQAKVPGYARRPKRLEAPLNDLNHLVERVALRSEEVHFFGGRDYLPLLHALTADLNATVIVHHKGDQPRYAGLRYKEFRCRQNQNWHYEAAKAFVETAGKW